MAQGYKKDIWILIPVLIMLIFSVAVVYSASSDYSILRYKDPSQMLKSHIIKVLLAIGLIFLFSKIDYRYYRGLGKGLMILSIMLLISVFIFGTTVKGVNRWLDIGPFSFQPSDLAKYTLIIYLSHLLVKKKDYVHQLYRGYLPILFYILLVTAFVAAQPNFSTAIIIFGSSLLLLYVGNVKIKHIAITIVSLIPVATVYVFSKSYILGRFASYAEYASGGDPKHQLSQAIIGIGSGGIFGLGSGNSIQKQYFLPEAYGDFIFAIVGEEYGFIGAVLILFLFAVILVRGYKVAKAVEDEFGKYLAFGITTILTSYALVNISVACGIIPTTGVPIPFISYGGTALVFNSIAIGILMNISGFRNAVRNNLNKVKETL
ncbi:MAG: FtsW/RodA/SpoVE family cell cycle protein [Ignavibacteria bacterium]